MTSWTSLPTEEAFITLRALGRVALTIRDRLSRLLEARSLFACAEVLVTNLVSDPEGDQRLLRDPQVQASDFIRVDDKGSSSESKDSSD